MPVSRRRWVFALGIGLLFACGVLALRPGFVGPEDQIYKAYAHSIVVDGDLNIAKELRPPEGTPLLVSPTYNFPDFHASGGVVVWAPFLYLYRLLGHFDGALLKDRSMAGEEYCLVLSTLVCSILLGWLTRGIAYRLTGNAAASTWATVLVFVGSPWIHYTFVEPGQANIVGALYPTALVAWLCSESVRRRLYWLISGLLFGLCIVVKPDAWFVAPLLAGVCFVLWRQRTVGWRQAALLIVGALPLIAGNAFNNRLQWGIWSIPALATFNPKGHYLYQQLFSSYAGFFYCSPLLAVTLVGGLVAALVVRCNPAFATAKANGSPPGGSTRLLLILMAATVALKIVVLSFRYAWGGGTFGARPLLSETCAFVALGAAGLARLRPTARRLVLLLALAGVLWNLVNMDVYLSTPPLPAPEAPPHVQGSLLDLFARWGHLVSQPDEWGRRFLLAAPVCVMLVAFFVFLCSASHLEGAIRFLAVSGTLLYLGFTARNLAHNQSNAAAIRALAVEGKAVVIGPRDLAIGDNLDSLEEMVDYWSRVKHDVPRTCDLARQRRELMKQISPAYRKVRPELNQRLPGESGCP